jgi:hypothetical protein
MPHQGHTHNAAASPEGSPCPSDDVVVRVAGASSDFTPDQRRAALRHIITFGHLIRRRNGAYGTPQAELLSIPLANDLKKRKLACAGFNHTIHPTSKGRKYAEGSDV